MVAQKKDRLCASNITGCHTVHTQTPARYDGVVLSCAKSNLFSIFLKNILSCSNFLLLTALNYLQNVEPTSEGH